MMENGIRDHENRMREILKNNRNIITRNVVPCPDLYRKLKDENILYDSMIKELQDSHTREERSSKLVDLIALRLPSSLKKFCDVLQLTGHACLAEYLRDQVERGGCLEPRVQDVFRKFPALEKHLREFEKEELANFMRDRIKEGTIKASFKRDGAETEKALEAKQLQLEQAWKFKSDIKDREKNIKDLEASLQDAKGIISKKIAENQALALEMRELKNKFQKQVHAQIQFNAANSSSLIRSDERVNSVAKVLDDLNSMLYLHCEKYDIQPIERQETGIAETSASLKANFEKIMDRLDELLRIKDEYRGLRHEVDASLKMLGKSEGNSLIGVLRDLFKGQDLEAIILQQRRESRRNVCSAVSRQRTVSKEMVSRECQTDDDGRESLEKEVAVFKHKIEKLARLLKDKDDTLTHTKMQMAMLQIELNKISRSDNESEEERCESVLSVHVQSDTPRAYGLPAPRLVKLPAIQSEAEIIKSASSPSILGKRPDQQQNKITPRPATARVYRNMENGKTSRTSPNRHIESVMLIGRPVGSARSNTEFSPQAGK